MFKNRTMRKSANKVTTFFVKKYKISCSFLSTKVRSIKKKYDGFGRFIDLTSTNYMYIIKF